MLLRAAIIALILAIPVPALTGTMKYCAHETIGDGCQAPREFVLAHKYHGILVDEWHDGQWMFKRDGVWCKLFTLGARKYIEKHLSRPAK